VSPEAKLRMLSLLNLTRQKKGMKECFIAAQRRGKNCNIFRKAV